MSNDEADEAHSLIQLNAQFSPGHVGDVISQELSETWTQINGDIAAISRLIPYITNVYRDDQQRQYAERELFRLRVKVDEGYGQLQKCLNMVADVGRPVSIKT